MTTISQASPGVLEEFPAQLVQTAVPAWPKEALASGSGFGPRLLPEAELHEGCQAGDGGRVGRLTVGRRPVGEDHAAGSSHDGPTGILPSRKELAMAGSEQGPDDVEGHRLRQDTEAADETKAATDAEGHALR
jgi:hypothetical protein